MRAEFPCLLCGALCFAILISAIFIVLISLWAKDTWLWRGEAKEADQKEIWRIRNSAGHTMGQCYSIDGDFGCWRPEPRGRMIRTRPESE